MGKELVKAVLFDLDGTLTDTEKYYQKAWPEALSHFGYKVEDWMYVVPFQDADLNKLSRNEQKALDDSIAKYASLSYDEIKEKSHDVAWRSTARDFSIKWEDIAREAGLESEELECINEYSALEAALN